MRIPPISGADIIGAIAIMVLIVAGIWVAYGIGMPTMEGL